MAHPYWPFVDLRIRTPRLELRPVVSLEDMTELAAVAARGVHAPDFMPFVNPWTQLPSPALERGALQYFWGVMAKLAADDWHLPFAIVFEGELVGVQGVGATQFAIRRTVATGSWLGLAHHGKGIGKEMRAAVLHFAFEGIGAARAETGAFDDNPSSIGVTRSLGYRENGDKIAARLGERGRQVEFVLDRDDWLARRRDDITVDGLEPCLPLLGAAASAPG